jgi:lyso-ornithine lipid O-acyltransferase
LPLTEKTDSVHPRAVMRVVLIVLIFAGLAPLHQFLRWMGFRSPFAQLFLRLSGRAAGALVTVKGTPVSRDVLYIANHVSWLDILVLSGRTGCAFVAKADMAPWPVLGWMATLNNSVYVERDSRLGAGQQATAVQEALKTHQPITLFPEGTTGNGRELLTFRSSLIAAVTPPPEGVSIQPVALDYGPDSPNIAWTDDESVGKNALRIMGRKGRIPITLHFLEPLDHSDFADRKAIAAHSRTEIEAALGMAVRTKPQ